MLSHENLLDLAIDEIKPALGKNAIENGIEKPLINFEEDDDTLLSNPDQIHLKASWEENGSRKMVYLRIGKHQDENVITIIGGNQNATPTLVVHINGDDSWRTDFSKKIKILFEDPYLCTPEEVD